MSNHNVTKVQRWVAAREETFSYHVSLTHFSFISKVNVVGKPILYIAYSTTPWMAVVDDDVPYFPVLSNQLLTCSD